MKKITLLSILALASFSLASCSSNKQGGEKKTEPKTEEKSKASTKEKDMTASSAVTRESSSFSQSWDVLTLNQKISILIQKASKEFNFSSLTKEEIEQQNLSHEWAMNGTIDKGSILIPTVASNDPYRISTQNNVITIEAGNAMVQQKQFTKEELFNEFYNNDQAQQATNELASKIISVEQLNELIKEKYQVDTFPDQAPAQDLNKEAILAGDFSTLVGTWKNGRGDVLVINSDKSATLNGNPYVVDIPKIDPNYEPYLSMRANSKGAVGGAAIGMFKIGEQNKFGDQSDTSKSRLVITQNSANFPADMYLYRD